MHYKTCEPRTADVAVDLPRLAIVCDFLEERWHSMDLVADMLLGNLRTAYSADLQAERLRPQFRKYFMGWPFAGKARSAYNVDRLINRFHRYPSWLRARAGAFRLFHVVDHSYAHLVHELPCDRTIVTCHDADTFHDLFLAGGSPRSQILRRMARRVLSGMRLAARVVCDSIATREELLAHEWVSPEKLAVVALGVDSVFSPAPDPEADAELGRLLGPVSGKVRLLHVGSTIPRKRIDVLLRAFAEIKKQFPDAVLLRAGGEFSAQQADLLRELHLSDSILVLPFLAPRMLAALYRTSALTIFPSEREGFGLPVIESMACGTPIVASDIGVLREAGGNAASYCPVGDVHGFSVRTCDWLREMRDQPLNYHRQQQACILQARKYSWSKYTAETVEVYREVIAQSRYGGSAV